jgi:hypothetical protein
MASPRLASVIGSRSMRTSSRCTGNGPGHVLGDDVLDEARLAALALGRADLQLLLRTRHRVVGRGAAGVVADRVLLTGAVAVRRAAIGQSAVGA